MLKKKHSRTVAKFGVVGGVAGDGGETKVAGGSHGGVGGGDCGAGGASTDGKGR